jgi:hypothetical protein
MVVTLMFLWHIAAVLTVMVAIGSFVHIACYRKVTAADPGFTDVEVSYSDQIRLLQQSTPSAKQPCKLFYDNDDEI